VASEVDICNIALGHLGDAANIQSISPPDGSAQSEHCARFYPIARDALMEMHDWSFAMRRVALAPLASNPSSTWAYAYAAPSDMINVISVLDSAAADDSSVGIAAPLTWMETPIPMVNAGSYTPQPFTMEIDINGNQILLTNVGPSATLRYVARVTDTTKFSAGFIHCLTRSLAALLAGPVLKGDAGLRASAAQQGIAFGRDGKGGLFGIAATSDAGNKKSDIRTRHSVPWINGR
jgi:hypothetical protein